jgi:hypothetical protein
VTTVAIVLFAAAMQAQSKDFTGKWTVDAEKTAAANPAPPAGGGGGGGGRGGAGGGGRGGGGDMTIAMDAKTLTITQAMGGMDMKTVYNLDGSESKNSMTMGGNQVDSVSTAKWDGAVLVITTKGANGDTTLKYSSDGTNLKSERTAPGRNGGAAQTRTTVYKKAT